MNIEFDPAKNLANIAKHGIDLAFGCHVLAAADCTTIRDTRQEYGEERLISLGTVAGRVWVVVHTNRAAAVRIISVSQCPRAKTTCQSLGQSLTDRSCWFTRTAGRNPIERRSRIGRGSTP